MRGAFNLATLFGSAVALRVRPLVTLATDEVEIGLMPGDLLEVLKARFNDADASMILASDERRLVRRFSGVAGRFRYSTIEVVGFEDAAVTFEHLSGPFAECDERFDLLPTSRDTTQLVHSGTFRLRGGLFAAPLAFGPVKRAFEAHVRQHLLEMVTEFE